MSPEESLEQIAADVQSAIILCTGAIEASTEDLDQTIAMMVGARALLQQIGLIADRASGGRVAGSNTAEWLFYPNSGRKSLELPTALGPDEHRDPPRV